MCWSLLVSQPGEAGLLDGLKGGIAPFGWKTR